MFTFSTRARQVAAVLVLVALVVSMIVAGRRIVAEQNYRTVNLIVNETDVRTFANANKKTPMEMLVLMRNEGVSQVLFKEVALQDLARQGKIAILQGDNIYGARNPQLLPALEADPANRYIVIYDQKWRKQIEENVLAKVPRAKLHEGEQGTYPVISVPAMISQSTQEESAANQVLDNIGVGFDEAFMKTVSEAKMGVIPQIRFWQPVDDASLRLLKEEIRRVPNLAMVMMNDKLLPGYPKEMDALAAVLSDPEGKPLVPLGIVEFSKQFGLDKLGIIMHKNVVRVHTITNAEMSKFEGDTAADRQKGEIEALDRWELAAKERNMRGLFVRFFNIDEPTISLQANLDYLGKISKQLKDNGFTVGQSYAPLKSVETPMPFHLLIGLGVCAGLYLLLTDLRLRRSALAISLLAAAGWIGAFFLSSVMALKLMALLSVMIFPTWSAIHLLRQPGAQPLQAVYRLLVMCVVSFIGAALMIGLLSGSLFMLKLDQFVGVKVAHVVPLVVVPFALFIWQTKDPVQTVRHILSQAINYRWSILFAVLAVALIIYVSRTGNTNAQISGTEMTMRQFLTDWFGVRPRSKEFLIGYPLTLLYFVYAKGRRSFWILTIPAVIGQVSLVNTYAHIHTPLLVSLQRSAGGLLLGILFGLLAIVVIQMLRYAWNRFLPSNQGGPHA